MSLITLTTDFGVSSPYVAATKASIWRINPAANVVDLTHAVGPQNVRQGALVLQDFVHEFPDETIHLVVVDPGVGTDRRLLYVRVDRQRFVLPDNGLISLLWNSAASREAIFLEDPRFWRAEVSATFHGRDIMAPVAAHLSLGKPAAELGPRTERVETLQWKPVSMESRRIVGHVIAEDSFGNLLTDITSRLLISSGCPRETTIEVGSQRIAGIVSTYGERPAGSLIALIGSAGRLEIAVVDGCARRESPIREGDEVVLCW